MEESGHPRFDGGLWRIWDGQDVIGWLSTEMLSEELHPEWIEIDLAFPALSPTGDVHDQPWFRDTAKTGSLKAAEILRGEVTTDLLGSAQTFRITWVGDDEFHSIKRKHFGFY